MSSIPVVKVGWQAGPTERGTLTLLYSCLITIFAYTWTVLHLNVPGLHEKPWGIALRKAKWMAITVLFPEFILSKAICELRLALHDLQEFDKMVKEKYKDGIQWTESGGSEGFRHIISWKVQYRHLRLLYWLFGLPQPSIAQAFGRSSSAESESKKTLVAPSAPEKLLACDIPESGSTVEPSELEPDGSHGEVGEKNDDGDVIAIEQVFPSLDLRGPNAIRTERNDQENIAQAAEAPEKDLSENGTGQHELPQEREADYGGRTGKLKPTDLAIRDEPKDQNQHEKLPRPYQTIQDWTLTHSYFANMGGLVYPPTYVIDGNCYIGAHDTLNGAKLRDCDSWLQSRGPDFHPLQGLMLHEKDIENQSKSDALLKAFAVLQITSIILTVIIRGVMGLPLT